MRQLCVVIALCGVVSCEEDSQQPQCYMRVASTVTRESFAPPTPTDLLLAVDSSHSMSDEQLRVHDAVTRLVEQMTWSPHPSRLGVITMDLDSHTDGGRLRVWPDSSVWTEWPPPGGTDIEVARQNVIADFETILQQIETVGSSREAGLEAIRLALDPDGPAEVAAHNAGFLRDEADLAVVLITDEDDCSAVSFASDDGSDTWCVEQAELHPVIHYVDALAGLKPEKGALGVRAGLWVGGVWEDYTTFSPVGCFATADGADHACGCWTGATAGDTSACSHLAGLGHACSASCDPECEALPGARYLAFATELGDRHRALGYPRGTFIDSICGSPPWFVAYAMGVQCVELPQKVLDPSLVYVDAHVRDAWTGDEYIGGLPRYDRDDPRADCNDCDACPDGAWALVGYATICLACGLTLEDIVDIEITVIHEIKMSEEGC